MRIFAEIDTESAKNNFLAVKKYVDAEKTKILAIVKANAYGHGAVEMSKIFLENGAYMLGVATVEEGIELRNAGIDAPILVLSGASCEYADDICKYDLTPSVFSLDFAKALDKSAKKLNKKVKIHIKINTGMNRLGFSYKEDLTDILEISKLNELDLEGIFTHFSVADEQDSSFTCVQYKRFTDVISTLESFGITFKIRHCCNSAATIRFKEMHLDMVRPGIILYGLMPSKYVNEKGFTPVMTLKARVTSVFEIDNGDSVSYGGLYTADKKTKIASVTIGYADGFSRFLSCKAKALCGDKLCNLVGKICMDLCMFDVTNVKNISVGDYVIIFGKNLSVDCLADILSTINYEVVSTIGCRVPRVYI